MINDRSLFGPENDRRVLDARELRAAICTIWWLRRVGAGASERLLRNRYWSARVHGSCEL